MEIEFDFENKALEGTAGLPRSDKEEEKMEAV
jgi:hypothetical protein